MKASIHDNHAGRIRHTRLLYVLLYESENGFTNLTVIHHEMELQRYKSEASARKIGIFELSQRSHLAGFPSRSKAITYCMDLYIVSILSNKHNLYRF